MIKDIFKDFYSLRLDFDITKIHDTSIKILEEIGIKIRSQKALKLLESNGCKVDFDSKLAKIPRTVIEKNLSYNFPLKRLYNRTGESFIEIYGNNSVFMNGPGNIRIKESNGNFRDANLKDLIDMTRIHDHLKNIDIYINAVDPCDIELESYRTQIMATVIKNTSKPCYFVVDDVFGVEDIWNMGKIIRGSEEELRKKPYFCIIVPSEAILGYGEKECDILIRCAELGIPTAGAGYPIMGLTAPLSCTGAVALANSNWLTAEIIKKSIDAKNPSQFNYMAAVTNMKNLFTVTSSPEIWLSSLLAIKLGEYYRVPVDVNISTDSKGSDLQMAYEKALSILLYISAGANILSGATNYLDSLNMASYEQVIIDNEIVSSISHYFNMIKEHPVLDDFEIIRNSLEDKKNFLGSKNTLENYREFLWDSEIFIKDNFVNWKKSGMPEVINKANKEVTEIIREHKVQNLSDDIINKIDKIVENAMKRDKKK